MRLYLIRHGQSVNNALSEAGRYETNRHHDPALTEIGEQQAELAANWLVETIDAPATREDKYDFTHIYCSAMSRALQTAQPIAKAFGLKTDVWVDIHEFGGLFVRDADGNEAGHRGMTRSQMIEQFPDYMLPESITEDGWYEGDGVEDPLDGIKRAITVAEALKARRESDERIALVSHGGFLDMLIKALLNQVPTHPNALFYLHYNTGITRIDFNEAPDQMKFHYMNRMDHLPTNLRTW